MTNEIIDDYVAKGPLFSLSFQKKVQRLGYV